MKTNFIYRFFSFVLYCIISSIIFLLVYSFFFGGPTLSEGYDTIKEKTIVVKDTISEKLVEFNLTSNDSKEPSNKIKLIPSEMEEYGYWGNLQVSCAYVEYLGEVQGVYGMKRKVCKEACGKRNMKYYSKDCENDLFVCYCKK